MVKEEGARKSAEDAVPAVADQSRTKNVAWLTTLAKQAFEQKRTHNCLALTRAILLIDPENADARALQAAMQSPYKTEELAEQTPSAAVLVEERVDPEAEAALAFTASPVAAAQFDTFGTVRKKRVPWVPVALTLAVGLLLFLATSWLTHRRSAPIPSADAAPHATAAAPVAAPVAAVPPADTNGGPANQTNPESATTQTATSAPATAPVVTTPSAPAAQPPLLVQRGESAAPKPAAVPAAVGTLVVSSSEAAEIYEGNRRLGATPATLQLSPGAHQIEYRHDDLRKTVSYVIRTNGTTNAAIVFDVTVQINARPWAQVFLEDGGQRKPLGQTPLSSVQAPLGGVLVFENPNFPGKTYRITGKESAIQITFP